MAAKFISLVGHQFGLLQVVEHVGFNDHRQAVYRCQCGCGEIKIIRGSDLTEGKTRSCGLGRKRKHEPKSRPVFRVTVIGDRGATGTHF
jgi:hypothetical protein